MDSPVACQPSRSVWTIVTLLSLFGAALLFLAVDAMSTNPPHPHPLAESIVFALMSALCFIGAFLLTCWLLRARIEETENGLRWRGLGGWKSCEWDDVRDYYLVENRTSGSIHVVQTTIGRLRFSRSYYQAVLPIADVITKRAMHAHARAWEPLGCRSGDIAPRRFFYSRWKLQGMMALFISMGLVILVLCPPTAIYNFLSTWQTIGLSWAMGSIVAYVIFIIFTFAPLSLVISVLWRSLKNAHQEIETDARGIVFRDGDYQVNAAWDEITHFRVKLEALPDLFSGQFDVHTDHGDFSFSQYISEYASLCHVIQHWAPEKANDRTKSDTADVLGGNQLFRMEGRAGKGERVYHYRTRTMRAFLALSVVLTLMPPVSIAAHGGVNSAKDDPIFVAALTLALAVFDLWLLRHYQNTRVVVSDSGLTYYSLWGSYHLPWAEISSYETYDGIITIKTARRTIRLLNILASAPELMDDLKKHTFLVIRSEEA
ncbi:MAG: hypothetical protein ABIY70_24350 [Capsulimonas sp.]|uniref:hypothetical protein n=1 Tax=Capsulimonas sp. TaxID=2494211 RepID=UPI003264647B